VASLYINMGRQPRWFGEGLATYLQTVSYDEASGVAEVGHAPANFEYLELLLQRAPDRVFFDDLWDWDRVEPTTEEQARLYQVSWAVIHYLADSRRRSTYAFFDSTSSRQPYRRFRWVP
jgi:hypothetical protein